MDVSFIVNDDILVKTRTNVIQVLRLCSSLLEFEFCCADLIHKCIYVYIYGFNFHHV